ncbi:glycosyltransferase [Plantibacter flavus]|uniref:glycosyltransferase family 2 protein n=1 Tax=Plantibacter flavus TaxID=150123 RepID=UPI003F143C49
MTTTIPDVSVLVVTHNHAEYLADALATVLAQRTEYRYEVVIADDASSDGTAALADAWVAAHPDIDARVLPVEPQLGITRNYWRAFAACRGRYVAVLEGDDQWLADDKLQRVVGELEADESLAMVAHRVLLWDAESGDGTVAPEIGFESFSSRLTSEEIAEQNWFATFSACTYRAAHLRALPIEMFEMTSYDWAINLGVTAFGDALFLPQTMTAYRQHARSQWSSKSPAKQLEQLNDLIPDYLELFGERLGRPLSRRLHQIEAELLRLRAAGGDAPATLPEPVAQLGMPLPRVSGEAPRVSAVLTSYNNGAYLIEAVNSILDQTMDDLELVIVDDASGDDSWARLATLTDPRVRCYRLARNQGGAAALNFAIQEARADLVAVLNSDDVWELNKLQRQLEVFEQRPELGAVFTSARYVGPDGRSLPMNEILPSAGVFRQPNRSQAEWLRYFFDQGNALCHPSILIRREFYEQYGLYDNRLRQIPDLDRWIELVKHYPIHVLGDEDLVRFRILPRLGNTSSLTEANIARNHREHLQIMEHFFTGCSDELALDAFGDVLRDQFWDTRAARETALALLWLDTSGPLSPVSRVHGIKELHRSLGDPEQARHLLLHYGIRDLELHEITGRLHNYPDPTVGQWVGMNSPQALSHIAATNTGSLALMAVLARRVRATPLRQWSSRARHHFGQWRRRG